MLRAVRYLIVFALVFLVVVVCAFAALRSRFSASLNGSAVEVQYQPTISATNSSPFLPPPASEKISNDELPLPAPKPASDAERTATLKEIARGLKDFRNKRGTYPASLAELSKSGYLGTLSLDSSYSYVTDSPDLDVYSVCTSLKNTDYECVSSTVGDDILFTLPKNSIDPRSVSSKNGQMWVSTSSTASTTAELAIPLPPGWIKDFSSSTYTIDLLGNTPSGRSVILVRLNLTDYALASSTLEEFQTNLIASYDANRHVSAVRKIDGFDGYCISGTDAQNGQTYDFLQFLMLRNGYVQDLAFFGDQGMGTRLAPLFSKIFEGIYIAPNAEI